MAGQPVRQAQGGRCARYCVYCSRRECKRKCKWEGAAPVTKGGGVSVLTLERIHGQLANEEGMRDVENTLEHSSCDTPGVCVYT